jgi:hypothetical protein
MSEWDEVNAAEARHGAGSAQAIGAYDRAHPRRGSASGPSLPVGTLIVGGTLAAFFIAVYFIASLIGSGASEIAQDSWLAPIFPSPGQSTVEVVVRTAVAELVIVAGLVFAGWSIGRTRAAPLAWIAYVAAFVLVPAIAIVATTGSTTTFS